MSRQPVPGAGAAVPAPSGAAARTPAPSPSCPLPPQRYRALRARYNALLVTLYERSPLTLREIAAAAGCTKRAVQMLARRLGCRPRQPQKCRPGTSIGVRREGPRPPPLDALAARRVVAAFADVAHELAASAEAQAAADLRRATGVAERRAARVQTRVMTSAARELGHLAVVFENAAVVKNALAAGPKHPRADKSADARKSRARAEIWDPQQRLRRGQEAVWDAHAAARRAKAAPAAARDAEADRRADAMAERHAAGPRRQPRIRRL
jgi:hypothetical protein